MAKGEIPLELLRSTMGPPPKRKVVDRKKLDQEMAECLCALVHQIVRKERRKRRGR